MARRAARGARAASLSMSAPKTPERDAISDNRTPLDANTLPLPVHSQGESELVREHSDWAHDIESDVQRDLARLANLAVDDNQTDPTRSSEQHYQRRLGLLLNDKSLNFACGEIGVATIPSTAEPGTPSSKHVRLGSGHANHVTSCEFRELQKKFDALRQLNTQLMQMLVTVRYDESICQSCRLSTSFQI
jgi:hypothetical protein